MFYRSVKLWQHSVLPFWVVLYGSWGCPKSKSGDNWNLIKGTGLPWPGYQSSGVQRACQRPTCIGSKQAQIHCLFCSVMFYCCIVMPAWTVLRFYPNHFCWCVLPYVYYRSCNSRPQVASHSTSSKNSVHAHVRCDSGAAWNAGCGNQGD